MDTETKKKAIEYHYDVGNDFYSLWLDKNMIYSCALWIDDNALNLEDAQLKKIDWHLNNLGVGPSKPRRILDVGCGWGALLERHTNQCKTNSAVGLTLSRAQKTYIDANIKKSNVLIESWSEHDLKEKYDGIVSIGAFEHFADNHVDKVSKLNCYSDFFARCHNWLNSDSHLCLQTITYKNMLPEDQNSFISQSVFPNSELPTVDEIYDSSAPYFTLVKERFDGDQYGKTCDIWLERLRKNKYKVKENYGVDVYNHYVKYLKYCIVGFYSNQIDLIRMVFSPKKRA